MGQAHNLPLHIQREAGVVGHPPESEEKWCEPRTASAERVSIGSNSPGSFRTRINTDNTDLICVLKTTLCE